MARRMALFLRPKPIELEATYIFFRGFCGTLIDGISRVEPLCIFDTTKQSALPTITQFIMLHAVRDAAAAFGPSLT